MKKFFRVLPLLAALASVVAQPAEPVGDSSERITDFLSEIQVRPNGDIVVDEKITVVAAGDRIKRGIYRDFPSLYRTPGGLRRHVAFDGIEVTRDGRPEPWHRESFEMGERIYFGSADVPLPAGQHTYHLRYRTDRQLVLGPEFDELYWNVTGNGWAFSIDRATARVTLPPGTRVGAVTAYTGPAGGKGSDWRAEPSAPGTVVLTTTRGLAPAEGFTISVTWPKGLIASNANRDSLLDVARDNPGLVLALAALVMVLGYYTVAWFRVGRDPAPGVIIPLYGPPEGFTPAAVRSVANRGRFDSKSVTATLIHLAVAGALRIRRDANQVHTLERGPTPADALPATECPFFDELFATLPTLTLQNTNHAILSAARGVLRNSVNAAFPAKRYFSRNLGWRIAGVALSALPPGLALIDAENFFAGLFGLICLSALTLALFGLARAVVAAARGRRVVATVFVGLVAFGFGLAWLFVAALFAGLSSGWTVGVFLVVLATNAAFFPLLAAATPEGRRVRDRIEGFRRYLAVGERERLDLENPPERTPAHYDAFLPYALALDLEQRWSEQFADVLAAADYHPEWYHAEGRSLASAPFFAAGIGTSLVSVVSAASSAPVSSSGDGGAWSGGGGGIGSSDGGSGSGGQGSSGGGGGGGGGDGW